MRRASFTLALAFTGVLALPSTPVSAQSYSQHNSGAQVDVSIFYDGLSSDGDWVEMPDYGWSWAPRVERGWRPYTRGQWVNTDDGWYWDSDERFGWAAYHYGRWVNDRYYGWVWVPGTEWAPAWVSWRHGNGYTGWAPLPPRATWQSHVGLSIGGLDIDAFIGADDYAFVQDRAFVNRGVYQQVVPPAQNVTIINVTNNVTNYTVVNERVVDRGIAVANVERAVGRPVPRARTVDVGRADAPRSASAGEVAVFRPVVKAAPARRPAQGKSLVKGEEPPPLLVERRKEREAERQQKGNEPVVTAKDVQQRHPAGQAADTKEGTAAKPQTPRDPKAQQADQQRAKQANDANVKAQADKRATDSQQAQKQNDQRQATEQQAAQQREKQASDANAKAQVEKRATDAQQAQKQGQQRQANQQQADQQRKKQANDADAKAQADQRATDAQQAQKQGQQRQANQQQADQQRKKQANDADAKAQADQRATDAQQAQKQGQQRQANQQQADQQRKKQASDADAKAQQDRRATDAQQAQKPNDQKQADQKQADQQRAKAAQQQAKDNPKEKGKKDPKASPAPPPPGE